MNTRYVKKTSRFFILMIFLSIIMITPGIYGEENKSQVKMSWEEFRQLLKLDTDEITLTWDEFKQLVAQTGENIRISSDKPLRLASSPRCGEEESRWRSSPLSTCGEGI